ncbi:FliM/FliN family flagellar motor switch protein [Rubripirellula sp.]|nr:FliM/FliN family flagellar motor switch protein [Rubripirellula sp.]
MSEQPMSEQPMSEQPLTRQPSDSLLRHLIEDPVDHSAAEETGEKLGEQNLNAESDASNLANQAVTMPEFKESPDLESIALADATGQLRGIDLSVSAKLAELSPSEVDALADLFRLFVQSGAEKMSEALQASVSMNLGSLQVCGSKDFSGSGAETCMHYRLDSTCLPEGCVVIVDSPIGASIIDRMLGGDGESAPVIGRELTAMESRLLLRFVTEFGVEIQKLIDPDLVAVPLTTAIPRGDSFFSKMTLPSSVVVIPFELALGTQRGGVQIVLPTASVKSILQTNSRFNSDYGQLVNVASDSEIGQTKLSIAVTVTTSKVRTADLLTLSVGDIITTEKEASEDFELFVQGVPKFSVKPGSYQGKKAVQIVGTIEKPSSPAK